MVVQVVRLDGLIAGGRSRTGQMRPGGKHQKIAKVVSVDHGFGIGIGAIQVTVSLGLGDATVSIISKGAVQPGACSQHAVFVPPHPPPELW